VLAESRGQGHRHFDVAGAASVTSGVMLLVYAMTRATQDGWGSVTTVSLLGASAVLLAAFLAAEMRSPAPLLPLRIFRNRMLAAANATAAMIGAIAFSEFFLLTLYMQQVLGYSAIETGVGFVAVTFTIIVFSNVAQTLVTRIGVRAVLTTGLVLDAVALALFTQLPVHGHYFPNLFPAFLISGVGLALSFVPVTIAALAGVQRADAGIASGLINTSRQVGGAVGLAAVTTIAASYAADGSGATGLARVAAIEGGLTDGFRVGFAVLTGAAIAGALISAVVLRPRPEGAEVESLTSPSTARLEEAA
jgi:Na+/melibiose symporter-like transporter